MPSPRFESHKLEALQEQDLESLFLSRVDSQSLIPIVLPRSPVPNIGIQHAYIQPQQPLDTRLNYSVVNTSFQSPPSGHAPFVSRLSNDQFAFSDTPSASNESQVYPSASFANNAILPGVIGGSQPQSQTTLTHALPARLDDWNLQTILSALEPEPKTHQTPFQPVLSSSPPWPFMNSTRRKSPTPKKVYTCGVCQKEFLRKNDATRHANVHLKLKPYSCDNCGTKFTRVDTRNAHVKAAKCSPSLK